MSLDLKRGYGRKIVYRKSDLLVPYRTPWNALDTTDPDYLVYYDSDNGFYYEAVKIETASVGNRLVDYQTRKLTYRYVYDSDHYDMDLLNGYNIPSRFDDKKKIYEIGLTIPLDFITVLDDSDGINMWKKVSEPGTSKTDYEIYSQNKEPISNLIKAESSYVMDHQINPVSAKFDLSLKTGTRVTLYGNDLVYNKTDSDMLITHGEFNGINSPILQVIENDSELKKVFTFGNATKTDVTDYYIEFRSFDSEFIIMDLEDSEINDRIDRLKIRYVTQAGDSEINVTSNFFINPTDVTYPKTPLTGDSDIVEYVSPITGTQTGFHPDHEPWKAFSDSDNEGYKAALGVKEAIIGISKNDDFGGLKQLTLKKARFSNTPAVLAPNRPYNFRIQTYLPGRSPDWQIIHTELGFDGYTFEKVFGDDSEQLCTNVRFVFDECQPDFDSDVNALEVKSIKFEFEERTINVNKSYRSLFVTQTDSENTFHIVDSETIDGFFLSGAGGGGGGWGGAGGCGGTAVIANDIKLKPGTYRIKVGSGGLSQGAGPNNGGAHDFTTTTTVNDGGSTYLYDVNRTKYVILVNGSGGGNGTSSTGAYGNIVWSSSGGTPGDADIDSDIVGSWTVLPGKPGGLGSQADFTQADDGSDGNTLSVLDYLNTIEVDSDTNVFGSGGGGGGTHLGFNAGDFNFSGVGGVNAGTPNGTPLAVAKYAGGGGGLFRSRSLVVQGNNGSSGYAYITFK